MTTRATALLALPLLFASSCSTTSVFYTPPLTLEQDESAWTRQINRPFDDVWEALVDHISGTFFGIDNFEKESGLLTLSFGASGIGDFVDGGQWAFKRTAGTDLVTGASIQAFEFDGAYVDYLERYHGARLSGKMNLFVRAVGSSLAEVKVRARYVVTTSVQPSNTWSFSTGGSHTVVIANPADGTPPTRTLRPTHKAEQAILEAIEAISSE